MSDPPVLVVCVAVYAGLILREIPVRKTAAWVFVVLLLAVLGWRAATRSVDFPIYHRAGAQVLAGDFELYPRELYERAGPVDPHGFRYAPVLSLLFVPFALLPLKIAALVFYLLKIAAFIYLIRLVASRLGQRDLKSLMLLSLLAVGGYLVEEIRNGNFHFFVLFLIVVAFDGAGRGRIVAPAVALAVATLAKLLPALLLGYFLIRRRVALCAVTLACLATLWLIPAAFVGLEANTRLFAGFVRYAFQKADEQGNHSLRGAVFRHLTPHPPDDPRYDTSMAALSRMEATALWFTLGLGGAALLGAVLWRAPRDELDRLLTLSLLVTAMLLGSPHTQRLHYSALVLPAAVLLAWLRQRPAGLDLTLIRASLGVVFAAGTLAPVLLFTRSAALVYEGFSPHFWAASFLGGSLAVLRWRRSGVSAQE